MGLKISSRRSLPRTKLPNSRRWLLANRAAALSAAAAQLAAAGIETARLDAELLLAHVLGAARLDMLAQQDTAIDDTHVEAFNALIKRRVQHEPIAYILGVQEFWSLPFRVTPDVLIPRPDSEISVELVLANLPHDAAAHIIDFGTGSGCLLAALLHERPNARGMALEASAGAAEIAGRNFSALGLSERVDVKVGDGFERLPGLQCDILISNPPYISIAAMADLPASVAQYEPHVALEAGAEGLGYYERLAELAPQVLRAGGLLAFEIGFDQADRVSAFLRPHFQNVTVHQDLAGRDRVILAK